MNSLMTMRIALIRVAACSINASTLHAPLANRPRFDGAEDHILDQESDHDDREEPGKDIRDLQLILVLVDEPAQSAGTRRNAKYQLRRDQRAPSERPADLESRQDARERGGNQDL